MKPLRNDLIHRVKKISAQILEDLGNFEHRQISPHEYQTKGKETSHQNHAIWENRADPWENWVLYICSPLCLTSHGGRSLFSSLGDHAGINCQACLTPPCHLIIACNTPECWRCWAIDSWHSLKLLIIFSHKPLSDLSTSLYCLWRGKKKHTKISGL